MNNNIARMMNSTLRLSGLASGLDTDTMVKQLMRIETMKVDKVKQQKQLLEWKRDGYRNITNSLRGFRDTYLDVLSATNMKSEKNYKVFSITSSDSNYVTAKGLADATAGSHSIQVNNVATAEVRQSNTGVTKDVLGNAITDTNAANASGKSFNVTIDGTTKTVNIGTVANLTDLEASIQLGIDNAFGSGKVQVDLTAENKLTFLPVGVGVGKITLGNATVDNGLDIIGFTSGASFSNRLSTTD
ncbi:MAG: flagellar cap protein FliD N-terminal domain-containing protein, partial [Clostridiaceae bacterium]|nr:flagellar cap protein FliD N-terminal domain-containing protein [Clostridiaceae bacterium]